VQHSAQYFRTLNSARSPHEMNVTLYNRSLFWDRARVADGLEFLGPVCVLGRSIFILGPKAVLQLR
jgi:hypothetical protein